MAIISQNEAEILETEGYATIHRKAVWRDGQLWALVVRHDTTTCDHFLERDDDDSQEA